MNQLCLIILAFGALPCYGQDTIHDNTVEEWMFPDYEVHIEHYHRLNKIRKDRRLKKLKRSSELEKRCGNWLKEMHRKHDKLTHADDLQGGETELLTNGYDPITSWMGSRPHRSALLSKRNRKIGIVYVKGDWCARLK